MQIFEIKEASHYCSSFFQVTGIAERSLSEFQRTRFKGPRSFSEGTCLFDEYRACSMREVDRLLFLAASQYRRSLDAMIASASPWAHVTLYYGCYFTACALLSMFGCSIFHKRVVDVENRFPGQQKLRVRKIGNGRGQQETTYNGAHRQFWDLFYRAVVSLRPNVPKHLAVALTPVSNDPVWLISRRNDVNYNSYESIRLIQDFQSNFSKQSFPGKLPGILATQWGIFELLLELAFDFVHQFNIQTDALSSLTTWGTLPPTVRQLVYGDHPPGLVQKTIKHKLIRD